MRISPLSRALLAAALLPFTASATLPAEPQPRDAKADRFLGNALRVGVYVYVYSWDQWKDATATDLHDAVNQIADMGFTSIYFGGVSDKNPERWEALLEVCAERKLAVVAQLDFAYLQLDSDVEALARKAIPFIRKYKDHPAVLAFSIKEEPGNLEWVPKLKAYYSAILKEVPDAPLHLLEASLPVMKAQLPPYPQYTGTDRYAFWWEFSPANNRATPRSALAWYRSQADAFYQQAAARGQNFELVFTDWIQQITFPDSERLRKTIYPKDLPDAQRDAALARFQKLAREGKQGLSLAEDGKSLRVWKYYRPPANCMSAMAWLGIMEGADSLSVYTWAKPRTEIRWHKSRGTGAIQSGLLGWEESGTPSLAEYAAFARELRPFGRLLRSIAKETTALVREPLGHEVAETAPLADPLLEVKEKDVSWRSFRVPGFAGKVAIVVNTEVGSWAEGRSPTVLGDKDAFRINDRGELTDYLPYTVPRRFPARILREKPQCMDLLTGKPVPVGDNGEVLLSILPGKGRILYISPDAEKEYPAFVKRFACHPAMP